jgi:hypothetical protein
MTSRPGPVATGALVAVLACLVGPVGGAAAQVRITSGPSGPVNDRNPEFTFDGAPRFECRFHPAPPGVRACESPERPAEGVEYAFPLEDGDYVFEVTGFDLVGNPVGSDSRSFTVDTQPPQTEITGGPGDTTATNATFLFSASGATSVSCRLDGGAWEVCGSPQTYSGLSLGPHTFEVRATDAAGNTDPTPAQHAWQVLRPGLVIPNAVRQATALARELVQIRRALAKMGLRALARRRAVVFRTFDALTAGSVAIRARARLRQGARRRWIGALKGRRQVPGAGRHRLRATVSKRGRRLARRRQRLPLELRLSFTDLAGRSLWATSDLTLKR